MLADIALLRPDGGEGRGAARLVHVAAVKTGDDRADRRLDRVALGAARRRLRPRGRRRARSICRRLIRDALWLAGGRRRLHGRRPRGRRPRRPGARRPCWMCSSRSGRSSAFLDVHSPLSRPDDTILWDIRAPRVILGALVGAMLALAGASYQGVFRNPLADPYLLGVAAGPASARRSRSSTRTAHLAAACRVPRRRGRRRRARTRSAARPGTACTARRWCSPASPSHRSSPPSRRSSSSSTPTRSSRSTGGSSAPSPSSGWHQVGVLLPYVVVATVGILLHRRLLDVMSVGDEEAASLGVNVRQVRLAVVVCATVGTAAAVAVAGLIGFVGIIVPHAIRLVAGRATGCCCRCRSSSARASSSWPTRSPARAFSPAELPIGVVTAFFGAPFFAIVLRTSPEDGGVMRPGRPADRRARRPERRRRRLVRRCDDGEWVALIGPNGAGKTTLAARDRRPRPVEGDDRARRRAAARARAAGASLGSSRSSRRRPTMPLGMTVREYVLLGRTPHSRYLGARGPRAISPPPTRRSRASTSSELARPEARHALRRRAAAGRPRPRARAGGSAPAPRRADERPRPRPPAGGARADRRAPPRRRPDRPRDDARPHARGPVRLAARSSCRGRVVAEGAPREVLTEPLIEEHYGAKVRVLDGITSSCPVRR